jgi:hypothetical protein
VPFAVVYQPATKPAKGPQPGASALLAWSLHNFPPGKSLGIYVVRPVRGGLGLSLHSEGRALDVGYPAMRPQGHPVGWKLARTLERYHESLGVMEIIFARHIWSNTKAAQGWRNYTGEADHFDHVHIGLTRAAARDLTVDMINAAVRLPPNTPLPTGVVMPTPATGSWSLCDAGAVRATVAALYAIHRNTTLDANDAEVNQWMMNDLLPRLVNGEDPAPTIAYLNGALAKEVG